MLLYVIRAELRKRRWDAARVSAETGLSLMSARRFMEYPLRDTKASTLDRLCRALDLKLARKDG